MEEACCSGICEASLKNVPPRSLVGKERLCGIVLSLGLSRLEVRNRGGLGLFIWVSLVVKI